MASNSADADKQETFGDKAFEEGRYRDAALHYSNSLKPFRGLEHEKRIAVKQTKAMRKLFEQEPK